LLELHVCGIKYIVPKVNGKPAELFDRDEVIAALEAHKELSEMQKHAAIYGDAGKGGRPRKRPKPSPKKQPAKPTISKMETVAPSTDSQQLSPKEVEALNEKCAVVREMMQFFHGHYIKKRYIASFDWCHIDSDSMKEPVKAIDGMVWKALWMPPIALCAAYQVAGFFTMPIVLSEPMDVARRTMKAIKNALWNLED